MSEPIEKVEIVRTRAYNITVNRGKTEKLFVTGHAELVWNVCLVSSHHV